MQNNQTRRRRDRKKYICILPQFGDKERPQKKKRNEGTKTEISEGDFTHLCQELAKAAADLVKLLLLLGTRPRTRSQLANALAILLNDLRDGEKKKLSQQQKQLQVVSFFCFFSCSSLQVEIDQGPCRSRSSTCAARFRGAPSRSSRQRQAEGQVR